MIPEEIKKIIEKAVKESMIDCFPKEWLTKEDLKREFGIEESTIYRCINDKRNPLKYSTFGTKKKLFNREDINSYLNINKRNII